VQKGNYEKKFLGDWGGGGPRGLPLNNTPMILQSSSCKLSLSIPFYLLLEIL